MTKHRLEPARLKPGVLPADLPGPRPSDTPAAEAPRVLRGRALIFWDPKTPGRKLDAIDTDQITPAADCVSESLETLDERWKAGLVPLPHAGLPRSASTAARPSSSRATASRSAPRAR